MLHLLIQKIENRKSKPSVRFHFEEGMSYEEKKTKKEQAQEILDKMRTDLHRRK